MEELALLLTGLALFQHYYSVLILGVTYEDDDFRRIVYGEYYF